jgi:hypothetical protein
MSKALRNQFFVLLCAFVCVGISVLTALVTRANAVIFCTFTMLPFALAGWAGWRCGFHALTFSIYSAAMMLVLGHHQIPPFRNPDVYYPTLILFIMLFFAPLAILSTVCFSYVRRLQLPPAKPPPA